MGSSFLQWFQCLTLLMANAIAAIGNQTLLHSPVLLMHLCMLKNLGAQGRLGDAVYLDHSKIVRQFTTKRVDSLLSKNQALIS